MLINTSKSGLFDGRRADRRCSARSPRELGNVTVDSFQGLLVDFCRERDIPVVVKGLRAVSDFDYELQMAQMNHRLTGVETLFVATNPQYSFLSSSLVKEVATWGGDVSGWSPSRCCAGCASGCPGDPTLLTACRPRWPTRPPRPGPAGRLRLWTCTRSSTSSPRSSSTPARCRCRRPAWSTGARCWACSRRSGRCSPRSSGTRRCCSPTGRAVVDEGRREAARLIDRAEEERLALTSETEVVSEARRQAQRIRTDACRRPTDPAPRGRRLRRHQARQLRGRARQDHRRGAPRPGEAAAAGHPPTTWSDTTGRAGPPRSATDPEQR